MNDKLKEILEKINLDNKYFNELENTSLEKVVIYKKYDKVQIVLKNDTNLSLELYKELTTCFYRYFNKEVDLIIDVNNMNIDYLEQYYIDIIKEIANLKASFNIFEDRLVIRDGSYYIELINELEKEEFSAFQNKIETKLKQAGFAITLDLEINLCQYV